MKSAIIIEKDKDTCEALRTVMVEGLGWRADCAQSIEEARALLKKQEYDLIILDHYLCRYDGGWGLLEIPGPNILVMSSLGVLRDELIRYGVRVLPKPFNLDTFLGMVT